MRAGRATVGGKGGRTRKENLLSEMNRVQALRNLERKGVRGRASTQNWAEEGVGRGLKTAPSLLGSSTRATQLASGATGFLRR